MTDFITRKTHKERMRLRQVYKQKFDKDLMSDLKSSFAGIYLKIILGLFTDPVEFDIDYIYKCLKEDTSYNILIEIFASRPDWYLNKIKNLYARKYKIDLEDEIKKGTLDDFKNLLLQILQCKRSTNQAPDLDLCKQLAEDFEREESEILTLDSSINSIFIQSSPQELIIISKEYNKSTQKLITETIDNNFKGDVKKLLNSILLAKISPSEFYANLICDAINESEFDECARLIVTRAEIDLDQIKKYYKKLFRNDIIEDLGSKDSSEYTNLLKAICNSH
jgi:annexin A7/11